jgi:hypothetical protein
VKRYASVAADSFKYRARPPPPPEEVFTHDLDQSGARAALQKLRVMRPPQAVAVVRAFAHDPATIPPAASQSASVSL